MNQRKAHLDFLRIFAIILVVFNHTPAFGFPFSTHAEVSWTEFFMLCVSIADKVAVPLFFMISGALLLAKKEALSSLLKKRVLRMICVLIIFLLAQNAIYSFFGSSAPEQAVCNLLKGNSSAPATWFLYAYLAFLLMLPLLRLLIEKMETQHFLYLIALHIITVEFIPVSHTPLDEWLPFTGHGSGRDFSNIYLYTLIGYYLEYRISIHDITNKVLYQLTTASIFSILIGAILTLLPLALWGSPPCKTASCFTGAVLLPCIFIYLAARKLGQLTQPRWMNVIITTLGSACFTVMLTENIFRGLIASHIPGYTTQYYPSIVVTILVCCCGCFCGIIAKRIPWIKNLV